jgi:hypothetical protein
MRAATKRNSPKDAGVGSSKRRSSAATKTALTLFESRAKNSPTQATFLTPISFPMISSKTRKPGLKPSRRYEGGKINPD